MSGAREGYRRQQAGQRVEAQVAHFYTLCGCTVIWNRDPGMRRGRHGYRGAAGRTPGVADFIIVHEGLGLGWWHEAKADGSKLSATQRWFRDVVRLAHFGDYVVGGVQAARAQCERLGIIERRRWEIVLKVPRPTSLPRPRGKRRTR